MIDAGPRVQQGELTEAGPIKNVAGQYKPAKVKMTVGAEADNVINVALVFQTENGVTVNCATGAQVYLSSDAAGDTIEGSGPDAWAIGTNGIFLKNGGDSLISGYIVSESTGLADLNLTHAGADTFYLCVIVDGRRFVSSVITFDATT